MRILGVHYSYNKKFENENNLKHHIQKIETGLKISRIRNLILEEKTKIFKTLAISKIIHNDSVTVLPSSAITQLNKIHKKFIWNHKRPKNQTKNSN